jgi:AsmA protein
MLPASDGGIAMKWIRLIFVALGGIIAVVIFFVVIGVPAQVVASSLSRQLEASTGLRLKNIGFAKLAILPELGLTLQDVSVEDAASGQPVFSTRRARAGIALESLLKGQIRITDIAISGSTVSVGNWKAGPSVRRPDAQPSVDVATRNENFTRMFAVEQLIADDCTVILDNGRERNELRLDSVRLTSTLSPSQDRLTAKLDARAGSNAVQVSATLASPALLLEQKPTRIEATIELSGAWQSRATIAGNLLIAGPVIKMGEIQGTFDRGRVVGSLSVSFARPKPFLDVDLDVEKLDLTDVAPVTRTPRAAPSSQPAASGGRASASGGRAEAPRDGGWSNRPIAFGPLRLFESNARIGAREIVLDKVHLGPANLEATLLEDNLSIVLKRSDLYAGQGKGELTVDATQQTPRLALRFEVTDVNVLSILTDTANFSYVDGRGTAKFDLKSTGESPLALVSNVEGTTSFLFRDGELRGLNLPGILRSVLETILSGWQTNASDRTKFSTFSASLRIKDGQARTEDVRFDGPLVRVTATGAANLIDQTLDFRLEPKLVTSGGRQGSGADGTSLGVAVLAKGPWSNPQIYADLPDILNNPAGALGKLRAGDKGGLPGMLGGGGAGDWMKRIDEMIGGGKEGGGGLGERLKQFQIPR